MTHQNYLSALEKTKFAGEIRTDYASRLSVATDNSIYQVIPEAVIFPKKITDIAAIFTLASQEKYHAIRFSPRGAGTGTNGQSLSAGIIIDCSKYMRGILEINLNEQWVRVQPGVVLDQLNDFLKPHQMHFAPEISPSNRATIGGMVNTDACGMGSRVIGRTSDHVLSLTCVLPNGKIIETEKEKNLAEKISEFIAPHRELIMEKFGNKPRTLCGYNLKGALDSASKLLCGSEGTLAVIAECKLKITPIPKYKKLVVFKYSSFDEALRDTEILKFNPLVVETIDEKLLDLARQDAHYFAIKDFIEPARAVNIVEFVHDIEISHGDFYVAKNAMEEKLLWNLRKKSVGLISKKLVGTRRPIPFVEDTAVPPEHLADYISDFKKLLDDYGLTYGMYGHVDAGCVHVRPALDMKILSDEKLIREISNKVVALIQKYHGVLWGEHGQGYRSEFGINFFGEKLHHVVKQIKTLFDPHNQLNPGKIAVPLNSNDTLVKLDGPLRGHFDKEIPDNFQKQFASAIACNGNGACFNYASNETMCPSFKVTQDRIHSPKGRAALMREWLRQKKPRALARETYQAMNGCLGCKACAYDCPLTVDVPQFKSQFLEMYHQQFRRPIRDYLIAHTEKISRWQSNFPRISNLLTQNKISQFLAKKIFKLVDLPAVKVLPFALRSVRSTRLEGLEKPDVVLLQDAFTSFYEPQVLKSTYDFLTALGYQVLVPEFFENGKPFHAKGFLKKFEKIAKINMATLRKFSELNVPIVGIDPSITLTYRDEYQRLEKNLGFKVLLLQEWLSQNVGFRKERSTQPTYFLISHCTEKSACPNAEKQWQDIFSQFGLTLKTLPAGCCGMAGSYGHEAEHEDNSKKLFAMDWQNYVTENPGTILATGYSCRSQVERMTGKKIHHPIEILRGLL
jgi:FAD/FMN-containing dehydrogenase/Fe-S oxidoreductase